MSLLLEPQEFRILDGLRLNPRKSVTGRVRGERETKKKGISIEFADYREYSEGDDLRHLDWNVLARLDTPVMRTYRDEEDLLLHVLLDLSPSMDFGEPSKLALAKKLGAAVSYVALNGGDAVSMVGLTSRTSPSRVMRGRSSYPAQSRWLAGKSVPETPGDPLAKSIRQFTASSARVGMVLLLSDGLDPDLAAAVHALAGRGHEVLFLQILSDVELDPDLEGDLRLIDAEGGTAVEITANGAALAEYRKRLAAHNAALAGAVRRVGGRYALVRPTQSVSDILRNIFRRDQWLV